MNKIYNFVKEKKGYILSFCIPLILLILIFASKYILGNSKYLIMTGDMKSQYYPLFNYLKDIFNGDASIFYSNSIGAGQGMFSTIAYYLISPFNLLLLIPKINVDQFMTWSVILKLSLSSLTMFVCLKNIFKEKKDFWLVIFSLCYGLSSFAIGYYINILWMDIYYLLPLVILGIHKIVNERKVLLYGISLFLSILCNFYLGYMVCLFSVFYFIYLVFLKYDYNKNKKKMIRCALDFGVTSICFGLMSFVVMYPVLVSLFSVNRFTDVVKPLNGNILDLLSHLYIGTFDFTQLLSLNGPLLYAGSFVLILVILYFFNSKISKKEKVYSFIFLLFMMISCFYEPLYLIWNAFTSPIGFAYRFSFIIISFCILLSVNCFKNIDGVSTKKLLIPLCSYIVSTILVLFNKYEYINIYYVLISVVLFVIYLLFIYFIIKPIKIDKKAVISFMVLLTIGEVFVSSYMLINPKYFTMKDQLENYNEMMKDKVSNLDINDSRFATNFRFSSLDGLLYNYNDAFMFLSTSNYNMNKFYTNVGLNKWSNSFTYDSNITPFLESILSIRYVMTNDEKSDYIELDRFEESIGDGISYGLFYSDIMLYENPYYLKLGFIVNDNALEDTSLDNSNPLLYQEYILNSMTGVDNNLYNEQIVSKEDNVYKIKVETTEDIYLVLNVTLENRTDFKIYVNGYQKEVYENINSLSNRIICLNNEYTIGEELVVEFESDSKINSSDLKAYSFNFKTFEDGINLLREKELNVLEYGDGYLKGTIDIESDEILFTSIPYEPGWKAYVDGNEVEIIKLYDVFNGIRLSNGSHEIEFIYNQPNLILGVIISLISFISFVVYYINREKISKFLIDIYITFEEIILYLIVGVLTTVVNIVAYAIFAKSMSINYMISTVIAWLVAVIFAYIANKQVVFKSKLNTKEELLKEAYEFFKFRLISLGMEVVLMYLFVSIINMNDIIAKIIINIVVIVSNYIFSKLFIFKKKED